MVGLVLPRPLRPLLARRPHITPPYTFNFHSLNHPQKLFHHPCLYRVPDRFSAVSRITPAMHPFDPLVDPQSPGAPIFLQHSPPEHSSLDALCSLHDPVSCLRFLTSCVPCPTLRTYVDIDHTGTPLSLFAPALVLALNFRLSALVALPLPSGFSALTFAPQCPPVNSAVATISRPLANNNSSGTPKLSLFPSPSPPPARRRLSSAAVGGQQCGRLSLPIPSQPSPSPQLPGVCHRQPQDYWAFPVQGLQVHRAVLLQRLPELLP